jgi:hypothetical protein
MDQIKFQIVPGSDAEYVKAIEKMRTEGLYIFEKATLGPISEIQAEGLRTHDRLQEILSQGMRVFQNLTFTYPDKYSLTIRRQPEPNSLFDEVSISRNQQTDVVDFVKFAAVVQKCLGQTSILNIGNLLGPAATQHFEAREIALARLERMSSTLLQEMEEARKRREQEFEAKENSLNVKIEQKHHELDEVARNRNQELDRRAEALEQLQKELDDRAAKHARRQHYKDIKEKFKTWSETFEVTKGTSRLRKSVLYSTLVPMILFAGLAAWFLFQSLAEQDSTHLIAAIIKQITFTVLFVSTAYFLIRWNNQWFQRHANEEFRLKRMELDIDRASWFVEMAFEWKDEKGEEIPSEIIERLTRGLFNTDKGDHAVEPADSLAQALLGAARFKIKLADGVEAEYDRKGIEKMIRQSPQRQSD